MAVKSPPTRDPSKTARTPRVPRPAPTPPPPRRNERFAHDLCGVALLALGLVLLVCLVLGHRAGTLGTMLADGLRTLVGIGAWAAPPLLMAGGALLIAGREKTTRANVGGGAAALFVTLVAWWHLAHTTRATEFTHLAPGGYVGALLSAALRSCFADPADHIILGAIAAGCVVWATDRRLLHLLGDAVQGGRRVAAPVVQGTRAVKERVKRADAVGEDGPVPMRRDKPTPIPSLRGRGTGEDVLAPPLSVAGERRVGLVKRKTLLSDADDLSSPRSGKAMQRDVAKAMQRDVADPPTVPRAPLWTPPVKQTAPAPAPLANVAPDAPLLPTPEHSGEEDAPRPFVLPPLSLLNEAPPRPVRADSDGADKQAILMQTLQDFRIGANVAEVAHGPTVTRYEVQLEPGILVKKIVALADNLAMSLAAIDVRVEAPIPGKSAIGIEVPNDVTEMVSLRECLSTEEFVNAPSKLTFALGKDVSGTYKYADLTRMPHLLVGGSTNSGKSVCLNTIICSILYRATPREVRFVMIDPKRVELSLYDGIPHLLSPVVKNVKQAAGIFRAVLKEMEDRYDKFARIGTRNIEGYNGRVEEKDKLPFIVVVVDELADLMMQQGPEVETSICRLAQLARATGIHLVIATQRPSVDVITGTIKANISSRIAFAVATQVDSRTILDSPGADRLIGRGDMLFLPIDAPKALRVQGCYVGERETESLVSYLKEQEGVNYTLIPSETGDGGSGGGMDEDDGSSDELFEPCVRWLILQGSCSTSSLQRKFKIGYTRAARLVEVMEARGIVSSQDGIKPRDILLRSENVDVFFGGAGQGDLGQG